MKHGTSTGAQSRQTQNTAAPIECTTINTTQTHRPTVPPDTISVVLLDTHTHHYVLYDPSLCTPEE